jgi:hypothetical protein
VGARVDARSPSPTEDGVYARVPAGAGDATASAVVAIQAATSGVHANAIKADSANPDAPAIRVRAAGDLLRLLRDVGTVVLEVTQDGIRMTAPDDQTTLIAITGWSDVDPNTSADLLQVTSGETGVITCWLNEHGNPRAQAAATNEAALRLYGRPGQSANILQVLDNRTDANVLFRVAADGSITTPGVTISSGWTALGADHPNYTPEDPSSGTGYEPAYRVEGDLVRLRGRYNVTNTTNADVIVTVPAAIRPDRAVYWQYGNNAGTAITGQLQANGQMVVNRTVSSAGFVSVDGITYPVDA